jgi:hypothetical protein
MGFINFLPLWLGLAALGLALPILIHLIRRIRRVEWGAMAILLRAMKRRKKRIRMEDLLVLILRCAALVLLALALLRPTLVSRAGAWLLGSQSVGMVIAIDASFSTAHGSGTTRFDDAIAAALTITATLDPGDPLAIVLLGSTPHVLLQKSGYDELHVSRVLAEAKPLPEALHLDACIEPLKAMMISMDTPVQECHIISDAQAASWRSISDRGQRLLTEMSTNTEQHKRHCYFVQTASAHGENVAITRLDYAGGTLRKEGTAGFVAEVINTGKSTSERITVGLEVNGRHIDTRVLGTLPPGRSRMARFSVPFTQSGPHKLIASLTGDASLGIDDTRYAVARIPEKLSVLCIEDNPFSVEQQEAETYFLQKAIRLKGVGAAVGVRFETVSPSGFGLKHLEDAELVILANVADLSSDAAAMLGTAVRRGMGLLIFTGDAVDPQRLNDVLGTEQGLLPAKLLEARTQPEARAVPLSISDASHPVGAALAGLSADLRGSTRFWGYIACRPTPDARTVLELANGMPLLIEKPVGLGRVLLFTSSPDRSWNDLPISPIYPIWLHTVASHVTGAGLDALEVGRDIRVSARHAGPAASITTPAGDLRRGRVEKKTDRVVVAGGLADEPGFYELRVLEGEAPQILAANVDAAESDVSVLTQAELEAALDKSGLTILTSGGQLAATVRENRVGYEIWRLLLAAGLFALVAQAVLSDRFSKAIVMVEK